MDALDQLSADTVHLIAHGEIDLILGPPGTGKTTTLSRAVCATALARGADSMRITSFTTTAAHAIADAAHQQARGDANAIVPGAFISTLHSFGFKAIRADGMEVALDPKVLDDWNSTAPSEWRITPDARRSSPDMAADTGMMTGEGDIETAATGDKLLAALDVMRATLTPEVDWPPTLRGFSERWEDWKNANSAVDFGDMIQLPLARALDGEAMPGHPEVLVVDEAQDLTPAEIALALAWARAGKAKAVFAGDDDQAINEWRGGNVDPLLRLGLDADGNRRDDMVLNERVLEQSYRIPASVHAAALRWIERVSSRRAKDYHPREETGQIYTSGLTLSDVRLVDAIAADVHAGKSVMVLASCGYMLLPLINKLRAEGIPFHNQFRPAEARWNPLRPAARGLGTPERLYRYLLLNPDLAPREGIDEYGAPYTEERHRLWTGDDVRAWWPMLSARAAGMATGVKNMVETMPAGTVPYELIAAMFKPQPGIDDEATNLGRCVTPDLEWFLANTVKSYETKLAYPATVARKFGPAALDETPLVTVGTIHSVKGGGADVVYLSPDLSTAAATTWHKGGPDRDQTIRQFYVALTRAVEKVVVLQNNTRYGVTRRLLVPADLEVRDAA